MFEDAIVQNPEVGSRVHRLHSCSRVFTFSASPKGYTGKADESDEDAVGVESGLMGGSPRSKGNPRGLSRRNHGHLGVGPPRSLFLMHSLLLTREVVRVDAQISKLAAWRRGEPRTSQAESSKFQIPNGKWKMENREL
jgi:hypothetical protein